MTALLCSLSVVGLALLMAYGAPLPAAKSADAPVEEFSAARAHAILEELCQESHPVGSSELERVRTLIVDRLRGLGLQPELQERSIEYAWWPTGRNREARLTNIWVSLPGTKSEEFGAAFVCHYDSREGSPGATDDGAAVASFLESIRALTAGPPLERSVAFLFSDGEEAGLLGAEVFCSADEVGVWGARRDAVLRATGVFNFDAIGNAGPSILFETARDSGPLVALLPHALDRVYASSLGPTVYERMPNGTDFSVFKDAGARGLNFAVVGGKAAYHAPFDLPANQPQGVLQAQGDTILGLARETGMLAEHELFKFKAGGERVFFDLFGFGFVHYGSELNNVVGGIALALLLLAVVLQVRRSGLKGRELLRGGVEALLLSLLIAAVAVGLWFLARKGAGLVLDRAPVVEHVGDAKSAWLGLAGQVVVASAAGILLLRTLTTGRTLPRFSERRAHGIFLGGAFFTAVLLIAVLVEAPNGSYLFSWPLASLSLALMLRGRAAAVLRPILLLGALSLLLPTFATLVQLFSVHGAFPAYLGGAGLLLIAPYLFPLLYPICRLRRSRLAFAIVSVSGVLVLTISAVLHLQGS